MVKYGDFWVVCRYVPIKFLLIEIPLDAVEAVTLEVIVTFEDGLMAFQGMWRYDGIRKQPDTCTTWKWKKPLYDPFFGDTCRKYTRVSKIPDYFNPRTFC